MRKFLKIMPIMICLLFTGCNIPKTPKSRLVTELYVEVRQDQQILHRHYSDPQKMETVLSYLRSLQAQDNHYADPERYAGTQYRIELTYSDGSTGYVFQHADRFLSRDFHPWQEIDSSHAGFLMPLIKNMADD